MKTEFLQCTTKYQAYKLAPWAMVIAKIEGGFIAFMSYSDYKNWKTQK